VEQKIQKIHGCDQCDLAQKVNHEFLLDLLDRLLQQVHHYGKAKSIAMLKAADLIRDRMTHAI
jgi:hypothetical protein